MLHEKKPERKLIGNRNGLNVYSKLQTKKPLNKVSPKQRKINEDWNKTTDEKCVELNFTCEWCGLKGTRDYNDFNRLEGHHKKPRRYGDNSKKNCYVVHGIICHQFITDNNIDVKLIPNLKAYNELNIRSKIND